MDARLGYVDSFVNLEVNPTSLDMMREVVFVVEFLGDFVKCDFDAFWSIK